MNDHRNPTIHTGITIDLEELHRALAGVVNVLAGLEALGAGGSVIERDAVAIAASALVPWRDRLALAVEAEALAADAGEAS